MEIERKTVVQVVASVVAVGVFIAALVMLTSAYGVTVTEDNEPLDGDLSGEFSEFEEDNGAVTGQFEGTYEGEVDEDLSGEVEGTLDGNALTADFNGTISGPLDGTVVGEMNGTIDQSDSETTFDGTFTGNATGESKTELSPEGGLLLVVIIVVYIIGLPLVGYAIESRDFE